MKLSNIQFGTKHTAFIPVAIKLTDPNRRMNAEITFAFHVIEILKQHPNVHDDPSFRTTHDKQAQLKLISDNLEDLKAASLEIANLINGLTFVEIEQLSEETNS